jgi:hypothetical protein
MLIPKKITQKIIEEQPNAAKQRWVLSFAVHLVVENGFNKPFSSYFVAQQFQEV